MTDNLEFVYPQITIDWKNGIMSQNDFLSYMTDINTVAWRYWVANKDYFTKPYEVVLVDYPIKAGLQNSFAMGKTDMDTGTITILSCKFFNGLMVAPVTWTIAHEMAHKILTSLTNRSFGNNGVHFAENDTLNLYGYRYVFVIRNWLKNSVVNIMLFDIEKMIKEKLKIESLIQNGQAPQGKNEYWPITNFA